ncbi:hypothetical protein [Methylobacterium symbioticum]|nr:hypothetical protein [Methylobacterium symbioticum]
METNQLVDDGGVPIGTAASPMFVASGGSGVVVTQGPAATDTSANRWPVLAYQGGTWTFGLSGPIPAGSNVIGAVTQSGTWNFGLSGAIPTGSNVIGAVTQSGGPWTVQGVANGVPVTNTVRTNGINRSGTIGTTAVELIGPNGNRQGWKIKNDSTGDVWINFDTTATATAGSGNIKVPAGGYLASEPGFVETGTLSIIGSAAGLAITVREY